MLNCECVCGVFCVCARGMAGLQLKQRKPLRGEHLSSTAKATANVVPAKSEKKRQENDREDEELRREKLVRVGSQGGYACEDVDEVEEVLRGFDLDIKFGPCTGMTRMERWNRAEKLGLCPPTSIRSLLEAMDDGSAKGGEVGGVYAQSLFENRV